MLFSTELIKLLTNKILFRWTKAISQKTINLYQTDRTNPKDLLPSSSFSSSPNNNRYLQDLWKFKKIMRKKLSWKKATLGSRGSGQGVRREVKTSKNKMTLCLCEIILTLNWKLCQEICLFSFTSSRFSICQLLPFR